MNEPDLFRKALYKNSLLNGGRPHMNHVPGDAINPQSPIKGRCQSPDFTSAFAGTADMVGPATGLVLVAIDPEPTSQCTALSRFRSGIRRQPLTPCD